MRAKEKLFWPLALSVAVLDCASKQAAERWLDDAPREVIGSALQLTLAYNPGAAMGLHFDPLSRWSLIFLALAALCMVLWMYVKADVNDKWQVVALSLVSGGAVGNVVDRVRSQRGVVDFIDVGLGSYRFYTFNIADVAVTFGALILLFLFWSRASRSQHDITQHHTTAS